MGWVFLFSGGLTSTKKTKHVRFIRDGASWVVAVGGRGGAVIVVLIGLTIPRFARSTRFPTLQNKGPGPTPEQ